MTTPDPTLDDLDALKPSETGVRCFAVATGDTAVVTRHILSWPVHGPWSKSARRCPLCETKIENGVHPLARHAGISHD